MLPLQLTPYRSIELEISLAICLHLYRYSCFGVLILGVPRLDIDKVVGIVFEAPIA